MYKRAGHVGYAKMAECVEKHATRNKELMTYGEERVKVSMVSRYNGLEA